MEAQSQDPHYKVAQFVACAGLGSRWREVEGLSQVELAGKPYICFVKNGDGSKYVWKPVWSWARRFHDRGGKESSPRATAGFAAEGELSEMSNSAFVARFEPRCCPLSVRGKHWEGGIRRIYFFV